MTPPATLAGAAALARAADLDARLRRVLEEAPFARARGSAIAGLRRRPSPYRTSQPVHELDVSFADGSTAALLFKDLGPPSPLDPTPSVRPAFLHDPMREIEVYRRLLSLRVPEAAACVATLLDPEHGHYWLILERVRGVELCQVGEPHVWIAVARWLAEFHSRFADAELDFLARRAKLIRYDGTYYRTWIRRAQLLVPDAAGAAERRAWRHLTERYDSVVERLLALPLTFAHGEFYPSNILIQQGRTSFRVCPVDWETAALAPGLIDLAAFLSGAWNETLRRAAAAAYGAGVPGASGEVDEFLGLLAWCRLHVAVQWIGWSRGWTPPAEHRYDWFAEALSLAEQLGV